LRGTTISGHLRRCSVAASLRRGLGPASFGWLGRALHVAPIWWFGTVGRVRYLGRFRELVETVRM